MAFASTKRRLASMSKAAQKARITEREEPGELEDKAESSQYEAGEEGQEPIGSDTSIHRTAVGNITPRRPRRPY